MKQRISFHCHYPNLQKTIHYQEIELKDIPKWIKAYQFTHPEVEAITVRVNCKTKTEEEEKLCMIM